MKCQSSDRIVSRSCDCFKIPKALLPVKIYTVSHYDFNYNHAQ